MSEIRDPKFWSALRELFAAVAHFEDQDEAEIAFYGLAAIGARAKGFRGTIGDSVDYWLNLLDRERAKDAARSKN